jgi:hypothetical protein
MKSHPGQVVRLCESIIEKEAFAKGFVERKDPTALHICEAVMQALLDNSSSVCVSWGRCSWEISELARSCTGAVQAVAESVTAEELERHLEWAEGAHRLFEAYGVSAFATAVRALQVALGAEEEEEEESDAPVPTAVPTAARLQQWAMPEGVLTVQPPAAAASSSDSGSGSSVACGVELSAATDCEQATTAPTAAVAALSAAAPAEFAFGVLATVKQQQQLAPTVATAAAY